MILLSFIRQLFGGFRIYDLLHIFQSAHQILLTGVDFCQLIQNLAFPLGAGRVINCLYGVVKLFKNDIEIQFFVIGIKGAAPGFFRAEVGGNRCAVFTLNTL